MRIPELYASGRPVFSFEFFPPKTDAGYRSLFRTISELSPIEPGFVSVTCGAAGSTRRKTAELVSRIQREIGLTAMAHVTCTGHSAEELASSLEEMERAGIENVLALRGDLLQRSDRRRGHQFLKDLGAPQDGHQFPDEIFDQPIERHASIRGNHFTDQDGRVVAVPPDIEEGLFVKPDRPHRQREPLGDVLEGQPGQQERLQAKPEETVRAIVDRQGFDQLRLDAGRRLTASPSSSGQ